MLDTQCDTCYNSIVGEREKLSFALVYLFQQKMIVHVKSFSLPLANHYCVIDYDPQYKNYQAKVIYCNRVDAIFDCKSLDNLIKDVIDCYSA